MVDPESVMAGETAPVVLVIRDPEVGNTIIREGAVRVIEIDLAGEIEGIEDIGSLFDDDAAALLNGWLEEVADLPASNPIRQEVESLVSEGLSSMRAADKPIGDLINELGEGQETGVPTVLVTRYPGDSNGFLTDVAEGAEGAPRIIDIDLGTGEMVGLSGLADLERDDAIQMIEGWEAEVAFLAPDSKVRLEVEDLAGAAFEYVRDEEMAPEMTWGV
jgi:hypothetical protein